jgi:hypothetical protein
MADVELRLIFTAWSHHTDRCPALLLRRPHRLVLAQPALETYGELPRGVIMNRAGHPDNTFHVGQKGRRLLRAVTRVQDHQLDRAARRAERLFYRGGRGELRTAIERLKKQPALLPIAHTGRRSRSTCSALCGS